jgi:hypothetical protein
LESPLVQALADSVLPLDTILDFFSAFLKINPQLLTK